MKIFSDRSYVPENVDHIWQLSPFWGENAREAKSVQPKRFAQYMREAPSILQMTSLAAADVAVFPTEYQQCANEERRVFFERFAKLTSEAGKPLLVFTGGDLEHDLPPFEGYEFHTSLHRSTMRNNTFAMPATIGDIIIEELQGEFRVLPKERMPRLSFCGFAPPFRMPFGREKLKEIVRDLMYPLGLLSTTHVGYAPRAKVMRVIRKTKRTQTNVILRNNSPFTWAFTYLMKQGDQANFGQQRREYLDNLLGSPYTLCVRGRGNYSLRFYEALCCGRIPVFVNTDCVLPFEDLIHWKDYCVWVEERNIPHIDELLADFHARISETEFKDLQVACRALWVDYLAPESFMRALVARCVPQERVTPSDRRAYCDIPA